MRVVAHLLSIVLLVPGLMFATVFLAADHVTSQTGWLAFFSALLDVVLVLMPWALLSMALLLALAICGFSARHRWAAALCVAGIVTGSTGVLLWLGDVPATAQDASVFVPGAVALGIALWLVVSEWPGRRIRGLRTH